MSDDITIKDLVDVILNPKSDETPTKENMVWGEFELDQEVLPEGSAIVEETFTEISIVDLKGKTFKFPGSFLMSKDGSKITFKAQL